jgi:hypothetical protein
LDQNQPISPCNGDAISASVRIMARSLQHRRVAWMHDFRDSPTRRSSHSTNPEVERRRPRRDTAPPNFRVFKVNQPVHLNKRVKILELLAGVSFCLRVVPSPLASRRKSALHQESYRWIDDTTKDFGGDVTPPTSVGGAPTPAPPLLELLLQRPATPPHRWSSKSTSTVAGLPTPATSDTTS